MSHRLEAITREEHLGGRAVEYLGERDFPLTKVLHQALGLYMSRS